MAADRVVLVEDSYGIIRLTVPEGTSFALDGHLLRVYGGPEEKDLLACIPHVIGFRPETMVMERVVSGPDGMWVSAVDAGIPTAEQMEARLARALEQERVRARQVQVNQAQAWRANVTSPVWPALGYQGDPTTTDLARAVRGDAVQAGR